MYDLRVTLYSHYFAVFGYTAKGRQFRDKFSAQFVETKLTKKRGRFVNQPDRMYARRDLRTDERCYHINGLERFKDAAKGWLGGEPTIDWITVPLYTPKKFEFECNIEPWENQLSIIEHAKSPGIQKAITAQAGFGKTLCTLKAVADIGERFAVVTLGGYEDRWLPEFREKLNLEPSEIRSCCGCSKLYKLLREVKEHGIDNVKAIFISISSLLAFYKNWNNGNVKGSGCEDIDPATLWETLGVGVCVVDEAHKFFHANFITDLYSHVPKRVYLTATLYANTEFIALMYEELIPKRIRKAGDQINVYLDMFKVLYHLKEPRNAKFIGGQGSYSHTTYEAWISSDLKREFRYFNAIYNHAAEYWIKDRKPEHKLLIFAATIEMCQRLVEFFKERESGLLINSYTSGDDYQILLDSDIIISTVGKSGTAVDIPNLTQAYLTVAIDSPNANIQAAGRPRELKGDKKFPQSFHCFVCQDIDKHVDYWKNKEKLFKGRVKGITTTYLTEVI